MICWQYSREKSLGTSKKQYPEYLYLSDKHANEKKGDWSSSNQIVKIITCVLILIYFFYVVFTFPFTPQMLNLTRQTLPMFEKIHDFSQNARMVSFVNREQSIFKCTKIWPNTWQPFWVRASHCSGLFTAIFPSILFRIDFPKYLYVMVSISRLEIFWVALMWHQDSNEYLSYGLQISVYLQIFNIFNIFNIWILDMMEMDCTFGLPYINLISYWGRMYCVQLLPYLILYTKFKYECVRAKCQLNNKKFTLYFRNWFGIRLSFTFTLFTVRTSTNETHTKL